MKAAPYGSYSNIEYEEAAGYKDGGRHMNPQRYNGFPTVAPILQTADIYSDPALNRSNLTGLRNSYPLTENGNIPQGSSPLPDWRRKMGEIEGHMRNTRLSGDDAGYPKPNYQEGPSNYFHGASNSRFIDSPSRHNEYNAPKTFEYLERDRAELLRKLSELESQLMRSGSAGEQGKPRHHVERSKYHNEPFGSSGNWLQDNSSISNSPSRMADKRVANVSPYHEKHPYNDRRERDVSTRDSYLSLGSSNDTTRHGEYVDTQFSKRGATSARGQYQEYSSYRSHLPLQSADTAVPRVSGSPHYYNPQHQPDCSCFQCYSSNLNSPLPVPSRSLVNTRYTDLSGNPKLYHKKDAQLQSNSENSYSAPGRGGQINHARWPSAMDSTLDGVAPFYPESTVSVKVKHSFHPIAGGAPFVTCSNCYELLQIRREIMKLKNQQQKIQCAACSSLTYFFIEGKKLVFSIHKESMEKSKEMNRVSNMDEAKEIFLNPNKVEGSSTEVVEKTLSNHCPKNEDNTNVLHDDLNQSGCVSPLRDNAPVLSAPVYASLSNKSLDEHSLLSAVDSDSEDDNPKQYASTAPEEPANSDELVSPSSIISVHRDHHVDVPSKHAVFGPHSQIVEAQNEQNGSEKSTPRANVVKEISAEIGTVTGVPQREIPKANSSLDTIGGSTSEDSPKIDNEGLVAENIKARVIGLAMSIHKAEETCDVRINEHPIPDHLVRKAEDLAGPILPGNYWYDFRAGFWGVTGGPCLGIIPPKIQQFGFPISKNCSGGTTGVVVNGRELHKKDLALLHSRGLPIERGKSYILEISGRVQDEHSGEELNSLGPLAPTIERLKRGFGMRVSRH